MCDLNQGNAKRAESIALHSSIWQIIDSYIASAEQAESSERPKYRPPLSGETLGPWKERPSGERMQAGENTVTWLFAQEYATGLAESYANEYVRFRNSAEYRSHFGKSLIPEDDLQAMAKERGIVVAAKKTLSTLPVTFRSVMVMLGVDKLEWPRYSKLIFAD